VLGKIAARASVRDDVGFEETGYHASSLSLSIPFFGLTS
jgi:hypothetical protein